jgi:hypothetical protein
MYILIIIDFVQIYEINLQMPKCVIRIIITDLSKHFEVYEVSNPRHNPPEALISCRCCRWRAWTRRWLLCLYHPLAVVDSYRSSPLVIERFRYILSLACLLVPLVACASEPMAGSRNSDFLLLPRIVLRCLLQSLGQLTGASWSRGLNSKLMAHWPYSPFRRALILRSSPFRIRRMITLGFWYSMLLIYWSPYQK